MIIVRTRMVRHSRTSARATVDRRDILCTIFTIIDMTYIGNLLRSVYFAFDSFTFRTFRVACRRYQHPCSSNIDILLNSGVTNSNRVNQTFYLNVRKQLRISKPVCMRVVSVLGTDTAETACPCFWRGFKLYRVDSHPRLQVCVFQLTNGH